MINKSELKDGAYYIGTCRNTSIAKWHNGKFIFIGLNFSNPYIETIDYYGDVKNESWDGFIPIKEIKIDVDTIIRERGLQDYKNGARKIYLNLNNHDLKDEIWRPIPEYEGLYSASNLGRIKNHNYRGGEKIMCQSFSRDYLVLGLTNHGKRKTCRVHRLVASAFKNNSDKNLEVNHINGIKTDNREINLEWISHAENSRHTYTSGNHSRKLTPSMVVEIKNMLRDGVVGIKIAEKFNMSTSIISEINKNRKWVNIEPTQVVL